MFLSANLTNVDLLLEVIMQNNEFSEYFWGRLSTQELHVTYLSSHAGPELV